MWFSHGLNFTKIGQGFRPLMLLTVRAIQVIQLGLFSKELIYLMSINWQDTLRDDCDASDDCIRNCCVSPLVAPVFFVVFVLMAQFVLVNVVVAVLMKHLEVYKIKDNFAQFTAYFSYLVLCPIVIIVCWWWSEIFFPKNFKRLVKFGSLLLINHWTYLNLIFLISLIYTPNMAYAAWLIHFF